MVSFFIILLVISVLGMAILLGVKHYELSTGRLMFGASRPKISKFSHRMVFLFGTAVPLYVAWQFERSYKGVSSWLHKGVARVAVQFEHWLERVLHRVREKTTVTRAPGEASAFLREVGEYKKKLNGSEERRIDQE
jgi:hypothetical protein